MICIKSDVNQNKFKCWIKLLFFLLAHVISLISVVILMNSFEKKINEGILNGAYGVIYMNFVCEKREQIYSIYD